MEFGRRLKIVSRKNLLVNQYAMKNPIYNRKNHHKFSQ